MPGNDVNQLNLGNVDLDELTVIAGGNPFVGDNIAIPTDFSVGNVISFFVVGGDINNFVSNAHDGLAAFFFLDDFEVRRFEETEFVDAGV